MPTNLPPEYFEAEKRYREASEPREKISALEALMATIPKHKGTDKLRADLRKKLSKLREEGARKRKGGGRSDLYTVERQGAAQVALVGFPNSGKSSLLASLTNARPVIADFPMATVMPLSGMMPFEDIQFQLVDLPPIGHESTDGWVSGILRNADMLLLVVDLADAPEIQTELLLEQLTAWRIPLLAKNREMTSDGIVRPKTLVLAAAKLDLPEGEEALARMQALYQEQWHICGISNTGHTGLEALRSTVFLSSRIIRVYSKEPGKPGKSDAPFTLPQGSTVLDLAELIHKDFVTNLKFACIWGSAKFDGQKVQREYPLQDRDIVEIHLK